MTRYNERQRTKVGDREIRREGNAEMDKQLLQSATSSDQSPTPGYILSDIAR